VNGKLDGKIALVTGGSRGLGKWISYALAQAGAKVVVNYANQQRYANETVKWITSEGGEAVAMQADIRDEDQVSRLIRSIEEHFGSQVDILVNNATGPQPRYSIEESNWEIYLEQLDFHVKAPLYLTKAVLPGMKKQKQGRIINISSEVVQLAPPNFSNYVIGKTAMIGMTRSWANELGAHGITVNAVAPGFILVERHEGLDLEARIADYVKRVPLGHQGEPIDVGNAVAYLASEDAKFVTGQCLNVSGGVVFDV